MNLHGDIPGRGTREYIAFGLVIACLFVSSCGSNSKGVALAKRNVEQFHTQLNAEQYAAMYAASDEKLHRSTTEADFTKFLEAIHKKLGSAQQADLQNWRVAWYLGQGATVSLVYQTKFSEGSGTENFVWHIQDGIATLYGYNINSNELITK
jgi:hypothetical protein